MVTLWLARALLSIAVRRWPAHLRDELRAEWQAELEVLAAPPRPARMLWFSASLALSRPRLGEPVPFFDLALTVNRVARHALLLVIAPFITIAVGALTPMPVGLVLATVPVLLAVLAGAGSPLLKQWAAVIAVLAPAAVALIAIPLALPAFSGPWRMPAATVLWAVMLAGTLLFASQIPLRAAIVVAGLGGLAACWVASTLTILSHTAALGLDPSFAPLWYPAHILWPVDLPLGDPQPVPALCIAADDPCTAAGPPARWRLEDFTEGYPGALTITTAYTAAYVLGSASTMRPGETIGAPAVPGRPG